MTRRQGFKKEQLLDEIKKELKSVTQKLEFNYSELNTSGVIAFNTPTHWNSPTILYVYKNEVLALLRSHGITNSIFFLLIHGRKVTEYYYRGWVMYKVARIEINKGRYVGDIGCPNALMAFKEGVGKLFLSYNEARFLSQISEFVNQRTNEMKIKTHPDEN